MAKKSTKKKSESSPKNPVKKQLLDRQLVWVLIVMGILLASVLITYFYSQSQKVFSYEGLEFNKVKFDQLTLYQHSYSFRNYQKELINFNLYVRTDPRDNDVPVNGAVTYLRGQRAYISIDSGPVSECPYASVGIGSLSQFLTVNLVSVKGATIHRNESREVLNSTKTPYVTCETNPEDKVIIVQRGNETRIDVRSESCHVITINSCDELLEAIERFQIQSLIDARPKGAG